MFKLTYLQTEVQNDFRVCMQLDTQLFSSFTMQCKIYNNLFNHFLVIFEIF